MPIKIEQPIIIEAAGNKYKRIEEYVGIVNTKSTDVSIARVVIPPGWNDPGQKPEFTECRMVLSGVLQVESRSEVFFIHPGEVVRVNPNEWVKYSTPSEEGVEFISVCAPAFTQNSVHRDE